MRVTKCKVPCLVFKNNSVTELLLEIVKWISDNPNDQLFDIERGLQDMTVIFDHDSEEYVAAIYIASTGGG